MSQEINNKENNEIIELEQEVATKPTKTRKKKTTSNKEEVVNNDIIITVKGKELKLVLDTNAIEYIEDLLDESVAGIFLKMVSNMNQDDINSLNDSNDDYMKILNYFKIPKLKELNAIIIGASKKYNHGIKDKDILEALENYSIFDKFAVVLPLLINSKILPAR